jgi:hypothetical protein
VMPAANIVREPTSAEIVADSARRGAARRDAERGSAELLRLLRLHHRGRDVAEAVDAHRTALHLVRASRQRRLAA